jgi:hypothetical protein
MQYAIAEQGGHKTPHGKWQLLRPRAEYEDNMEMNLK